MHRSSRSVFSLTKNENGMAVLRCVPTGEANDDFVFTFLIIVTARSVSLSMQISHKWKLSC